jgi:hypothetical protein
MNAARDLTALAAGAVAQLGGWYVFARTDELRCSGDFDCYGVNMLGGTPVSEALVAVLAFIVPIAIVAFWSKGVGD